MAARRVDERMCDEGCQMERQRAITEGEEAEGAKSEGSEVRSIKGWRTRVDERRKEVTGGARQRRKGGARLGAAERTSTDEGGGRAGDGRIRCESIRNSIDAVRVEEQESVQVVRPQDTGWKEMRMILCDAVWRIVGSVTLKMGRDATIPRSQSRAPPKHHQAD